MKAYLKGNELVIEVDNNKKLVVYLDGRTMSLRVGGDSAEFEYDAIKICKLLDVVDKLRSTTVALMNRTRLRTSAELINKVWNRIVKGEDLESIEKWLERGYKISSVLPERMMEARERGYEILRRLWSEKELLITDDTTISYLYYDDSSTYSKVYVVTRRVTRRGEHVVIDAIRRPNYNALKWIRLYWCVYPSSSRVNVEAAQELYAKLGREGKLEQLPPEILATLMTAIING